MGERSGTIEAQSEEAPVADGLGYRGEASEGGSPSPRRESQPLPSRSAQPPLSEAELFDAYSHGPAPPHPLVEPCVCGVDIVCISDSIADGVLAHNMTPTHQRWRVSRGIEGGDSGGQGPTGNG